MRVVWRGPAVIRDVEQAGHEAVFDLGHVLLEESNRSVPIEEGSLQRSGTVDVEGTAATVSYDTPYAARLHENPQYHFQHGRRGKWLQLTVGEIRGRAERFLAERMGGPFR